MDTGTPSDFPSRDIRKQIVDYLISSGHPGQEPAVRETVDQVRLIPVKGTSMLPTLRAGDIIVIMPLLDRPPEPGEIVLLKRSPQAVVVHRVIKKGPVPEFIQTRGDSRLFSDGAVPWRNCAGRVLGKIENGRMVTIPPRPSLVIKGLTMGGILWRRFNRASRYLVKRLIRG
ncbi:MAG: S24/S26 family peptidase [Desulfosudaceae bacterium]